VTTWVEARRCSFPQCFFSFCKWFRFWNKQDLLEKSRSRYPFSTPFDLILHLFSIMPPVINVSEIWREYFHLWPIYCYFTIWPIWLRNAYSCPFLGSLLEVWPHNVVGYCRDSKNACTSLAGNTLLGVYIVLIVQEMRPGRVMKKAKKRNKRNSKRCDKSHICRLPRPPTLRYPRQSCLVGWSPGLSHPCHVSSKSVQGVWLPKGRSLPFSMLSDNSLYKRLGLPPNPWCNTCLYSSGSVVTEQPRPHTVDYKNLVSMNMFSNYIVTATLSHATTNIFL